MGNLAASRDEEAAIRRARELLGPAAMTPQVAQRSLRTLRRFCVWGLAVLEVGVVIGRLGLRGHASNVVTWSCVGAQAIFLGLAICATMRIREWRNVAALTGLETS